MLSQFTFNNQTRGMKSLKEENFSYVTKWINPEDIIQSEISRT